MSAETPDTRLKRLKVRSWRRGTREMDLILGTFFDTSGADLSEAELDLYEALLSENDHDIYGWFAGRAPAPENYRPLIDRIAAERAGA